VRHECLEMDIHPTEDDPAVYRELLAEIKLVLSGYICLAMDNRSTDNHRSNMQLGRSQRGFGIRVKLLAVKQKHRGYPL
jgi:hypothetical protein